MPNHITNYVEIKGRDKLMAKLIAKALKQGSDQIFDFNGIIPMPKELEITSGSTTWLGLACFDEQQFQQYRSYPWFAERYPNVEAPEQLREVLEKKEPETVKAGGQAMDNLEKYGAPTWYEWSIDNWGTKWNAYEASVWKQEPERLVLVFDTAWSPPEPVFDRLVEQGFEVNCFWQDEDQSNYGEYGDPWNAFSRNIEYEFLG